MVVQIHQVEITPEQEGMLPGLQGAAEWSLWVFPDDFAYEAGEIAQLAGAFGDLRGIVWSTTGIAYGKLKGRTRDPGRAFGDSPVLAKQLLVQTTTEYMLNATRLYSGVAWLSPDGYTELASLLSRSTGGADSTLSFIPNGNETAEEWTNIVGGLDWLWHCRNWLWDEPQPKLKGSPVLLSYIGLTQKIGGVAGLAVQNLDADDLSKRSLVFYGPRTILKRVAERLGTGAPAISASTFARWINRGAEFMVIG